MSELSRHNHIERARILLKQKRYGDAERHASAVLQGDPNDADALQIIGHCRLDTGKYPEAIQLFQQCLGLEPGDDYVHYLLAFAYYRTKNKGNALQSLQSAISLNPYSSGYYGLYAYIMLDENRYAEALEKANLGLAVNAQDLTCLNARGQALFRLKYKEGAYVLIGLYIMFVVFSWVGTSIANIMLLLSKEGKYVLTTREKYISGAVLTCLLAALFLAVFGVRLAYFKDDTAVFGALIFLTLTLPLSRFEYWDILRHRRPAVIGTIGLIALGVITAATMLITGGNIDTDNMGLAYIIGIALYTWGFSFLAG